jgi:hypothetical protein
MDQNDLPPPERNRLERDTVPGVLQLLDKVGEDWARMTRLILMISATLFIVTIVVILGLITITVAYRGFLESGSKVPLGIIVGFGTATSGAASGLISAYLRRRRKARSLVNLEQSLLQASPKYDAIDRGNGQERSEP